MVTVRSLEDGDVGQIGGVRVIDIDPVGVDIDTRITSTPSLSELEVVGLASNRKLQHIV